MKVWSSAIPAASSRANLLPGLHLLADTDRHAVFLHVKIGRSLAIAVTQFHVIDLRIISRRVHVELAIVRFNHRPIERGKDGHTHGLGRESFYLRINPKVTVVGVVTAIVSQNSGAGIDIDKVVWPKIAKEVSPLWVKRIFLGAGWWHEILRSQHFYRPAEQLRQKDEEQIAVVLPLLSSLHDVNSLPPQTRELCPKTDMIFSGFFYAAQRIHPISPRNSESTGEIPVGSAGRLFVGRYLMPNEGEWLTSFCPSTGTT